MCYVRTGLPQVFSKLSQRRIEDEFELEFELENLKRHYAEV
jgi:hypothetical protein